METKTLVLAVHAVVALGLLGIGAVSLVAGELLGFGLRVVTAGLVLGVGYAFYRMR